MKEWKMITTANSIYQTTVKFLKIRTPEKFAVITLKVEQSGFTFV